MRSAKSESKRSKQARLDGLGCQVVGRYLNNFNEVEERMDRAIAQLLRLKLSMAPIVTSAIPFARKVSMLRLALYARTKSQNRRAAIDKLFKKITALNTDRNVLAHHSFRTTKNGVQFKRTRVRRSIRKDDPIWSFKKFYDDWSMTDTLKRQLDAALFLIKPGYGRLFADARFHDIFYYLHESEIYRRRHRMN
jgi:hypothetical protein